MAKKKKLVLAYLSIDCVFSLAGHQRKGGCVFPVIVDFLYNGFSFLVAVILANVLALNVLAFGMIQTNVNVSFYLFLFLF